VSEVIAARHGERIMDQLGMEFDPDWQADTTGFKASLGLTPDVEKITYRDLQERRKVIGERLQSAQTKPGPRRKPRPWRRA
jgi:hypothetical protein